MTDQPRPIAFEDVAALDHRAAISAYLNLAALVGEGRPADAWDYIATFDAAARADMLLSGASMFVTAMLDVYHRNDITTPFPAWLRAIAAEAVREDGQS